MSRTLDSSLPRLGPTQDPRQEDLPSLPYMSAFLQELLRLANILVVLSARKTLQPQSVNGESSKFAPYRS